jgi:hypothetical protein
VVGKVESDVYHGGVQAGYPMAFLDKDGPPSISLLSVLASIDVPMEQAALGGFHTTQSLLFHVSKCIVKFNQMIIQQVCLHVVYRLLSLQ